MKGKNPTRKQKEIIRKNKLNPNNWLIVKVLSKEINMKHKISNKLKKIKL